MNHHRFLGQLLFARPQGVTDQEKSKITRVTSLVMLLMMIIYLWRTTCANFVSFFCTISLKRKKKKNRLNGTGKMVFYDSLH